MPRTAAILLTLLCSLSLWGCSDPAPTPTGRKHTPRLHLVELTTAREETLSSRQERSGSLRARRRVRIYNQEEGQIDNIPFYEGDRVKQGELLLRLEDDLLTAQLEKARATTRQAQIKVKRLRDLVKRRAASEDELERAQTALDVARAEQKLLQTRLSHTRIKAPFDGVISERLAEPGDVAAKHTHLLTLTDPTSLMIEIHVSELLLPQLKTGDQVSVRIDALGKRQFPGRIQRIHPELDPSTRQGVVEIALDPIPAGARAGQFARVTLESARRPRVMLPFEAIKQDRQGSFVYRLDAEGRVRRTPVQTGIRLGNRSEILQGLKPGDRVVTRGFLGLSDGDKVQPVER